MIERPHLALAFMEHKPEAAANALEELASEDAAALVSIVPARLAGPVLAHMVTWSAAQCASLLSDDHAAAVLVQMEYGAGVALLRQLEQDRVERILCGVSGRLARDLRRSLSYPLGTVGAWAEYDIAVLPAMRLVEQALDILRRRRNPQDTQIFVVDERQQLSGVVPTPVLLHVDVRAELAELADRSIRSLADGSSLTAVADLADWDRHGVLPVVAPDRRLLGALSRSGMRRGIAEMHSRRPAESSEPVLAHLAGAFIGTAAELLRLLANSETTPASPVIGVSRSER